MKLVKAVGWLLLATMTVWGCAPEAEEESLELESTEQALSAVRKAGQINGPLLPGPATWKSSFDAKNGYLAMTYTGAYCGPGRVILQRMSLANGANSTLATLDTCGGALLARGDTTRVFYIAVNAAGTRSIRRLTMSASGTTLANEPFSSDQATSLELDAHNVYWTVGQSVRRKPKLGGIASTLYTSASTATLKLLGADGARVFVDEGYGADASQTHYIVKVSCSGGTAAYLAGLGGGNVISGFTFDAGNLYWSRKRWDDSLTFSDIARVPKSGGPVYNVYTPNGASVRFLAVSASKLYWGERGSSVFNDMLRSRTTPSQPSPGAIADEDSLAAVIV